MVLLYGHPVGEFVAERDLLVKAIRAGGERALANDVKALRKPSAVAALVNEVVRADPDGVDLILQAAALLRSAQAGALEGTGVNASQLQEQYRAAVGALAQSAPRRRAEVRAALEAATIDEESNDALRTGCLVVVPTPVSIFGTAPTNAGPTPDVDSGAAMPAAEPQPVDELEERRARRRAKNAAAKDKTDQQSAAKLQAAERAAARKAAEAEKKAAAEAERQRKAAEKERQRKRKALQKQHREALRSHVAALDDESVAAAATEQADEQLVALEVEIEAAELALAELRAGREHMIAARDQHLAEKTAASERAAEAQAAVDELANALRVFDGD